jgi:nicotinamidase-related amidase
MERATTVFWDGDTQRDFLEPTGALYVPGAEAILANLARLTYLARAGVPRIRVIGSVCRHFPGDAELWSGGGPYPEHCMNGTPGQQKVAATAPLAPSWIENRDYAPEALGRVLRGDEVFFEKQDVDLLVGNRNARTVLPRLVADARDVVVYGVCTDICVDLSVRALLPLGRRLHVVTDAVAALDAARGEECKARWRAAGVVLTTTADVEQALGARA